MKKILALILLSLAPTADAAIWVEVKGVNGMLLKSTSHSDVFANMYQTTGEDFSIRFLVEDYECKVFTKEVIDTNHHNINGVNVKFASQCLGGNIQAYFPWSEKGVKYVIDQFTTKVEVKVEGIVFDANNFSESWNKFQEDSFAI